MKPNEILLAVRDALVTPVATSKGFLSIANHPFEVIELLAQTPAGFRVILLWEGDADITNQPSAGIVHTTIAVIVSQNRGLRVWKGENVMAPYGTGPNALPALIDLLDLVRTTIRGMTMAADQTSTWWLYLGAQPETTPDGLPLDAYRMRFRISNSIVPALS